jgi:hypothetical protein
VQHKIDSDDRPARDAAALEATGAALGSIGLMAFGTIVWQLAPEAAGIALSGAGSLGSVFPLHALVDRLAASVAAPPSIMCASREAPPIPRDRTATNRLTDAPAQRRNQQLGFIAPRVST